MQFYKTTPFLTLETKRYTGYAINNKNNTSKIFSEKRHGYKLEHFSMAKL